MADALISDTPWLDRTATRRECFMSESGGISYTYGQGRGVRTYQSVPYTPIVRDVLWGVNNLLATRGYPTPLNGCFLNCYMDEHQHLGWHADDFERMDHGYPIVSVSFGQPREIWWRLRGATGQTPSDCRKLLESGSVFVMPPGMQNTHEHRIPKGDRLMSPRVSLTFRRFLPDPE